MVLVAHPVIRVLIITVAINGYFSLALDLYLEFIADLSIYDIKHIG